MVKFSIEAMEIDDAKFIKNVIKLLDGKDIVVDGYSQVIRFEKDDRIKVYENEHSITVENILVAKNIVVSDIDGVMEEEMSDVMFKEKVNTDWNQNLFVKNFLMALEESMEDDIMSEILFCDKQFYFDIEVDKQKGMYGVVDLIVDMYLVK